MYGKICKSCGSERTGKGSYCKPCMAKRFRAWRKKNPEKARAAVRKYQRANPQRLRDNRRRHHFKSTYGITVEQYDSLMASQGGRCAVCRTDKPNGPGGKYFAVDHDHNTKVVRGLLCCKCNFILGHAGDRVDVLVSAIAYLQKHKGG